MSVYNGIMLPSGAVLDFSRPLVMSIVNCTPDSFYQPSRALWPEEAAEKALAAEAEGADIIDFGGESTRPGAEYVDQAEEIRRLIPALKLFRRQSALPVSVDTRKAAAARLALDEGADIINDVSTLAFDPAMIPLCAERKAAVVIMHHTAISKPYAEGAAEVRDILLAAAEKAQEGGVPREKIILDPGFGFNKSTADALLLLAHLATIGGEVYPLLVGLSRKRFIGELTGRDAEGRLAGTVAANTAALLNGADIIRVHDTSAAADAVRIIAALRSELQK
jgi:dihydropteroate synthase